MSDASRRAEREIKAALAIRESLRLIVDDEEVVSDTLEGEVNLEVVAQEVLASIDEDQIEMDGCTNRVKELKSRIDRAENRIERKKALLAQVVEVSGRKSMKVPTATITLRSLPPKPVIEDESKVPTRFFVQPDPKISMKLINDAFASGEEIDGVGRTNGSVSVSIRRL